MKEQKQEMKLPKLDDLFTTQEQRDNQNNEEIKEIYLDRIYDFPNHPFKVLDDEKKEQRNQLRLQIIQQDIQVKK